MENTNKILGWVSESVEQGNYYELVQTLERAEKYKSGIEGSIEWLTQELEHLKKSQMRIEKSIQTIKNLISEAIKEKDKNND